MFTKREELMLTILCKENYYITADNISKILSVSKKTIYREFNNINKILYKYDCRIEMVKGKGYLCSTDEKNKILSLLNSKEKSEDIPVYQQTRIEWIIKEFILKSYRGQTIKISELAEELYISETTLKNDLKIVKVQLKNYNLEIVKYQDKGLILSGNEIDIRNALTSYILEEQKGFSLDSLIDLSKGEDSKIRDIVIESIKKYKIDVTDMGFNNLIIHIEIALSRLKSKKIIQQHYCMDVDESDYKFICAKDISYNLENTFNIEIHHEEIVNIYQHLIAQKRIFNSGEKELVNDELSRSIKASLKKIGSLYKVDFIDDKILINGLLAHLEIALNRIKYKMLIKNEMLEEIKNSYPYPMELAEIFANDLEKEFNIEINQHEVGFLALHFCGSLERKNNHLLNKRYRVAVVCATGVGTSILLNEKLKKVFYNKLDLIGTYNSYQIQMIDTSMCDLIISTIPLSRTNGIPYLCVPPLLNDEGIEKIKRFLEYGKQKNRIKISQLFKDDLFFVDLPFKSKDECIEYLSSKLLENGYIDETCKKSFMAREKMATTEIGNYLSVPHYIEGKVNESSICVGILKEPILWTYGKVQIILMIAVKFSDINKENDFFLHIYQKFEPIYKAQKIIDEKSIKYIKSLFSEEEFI